MDRDFFVTHTSTIWEFVKIILAALAGFLFAIWGTQIGRSWQTAERTRSMARQLTAEVFLELQSTIPVAEGVLNNMEKNKYPTDPNLFDAIYSPSSEVVTFPDIGLLTPSILDAFVLYKQIIKECVKHRQGVSNEILGGGKEIQVKYLIYLVSLDAFIKRARLLLSSIQAEYSFEEYKQIPDLGKQIDIKYYNDLINSQRELIKPQSRRNR